jgi:nucleotide-binding universal stress UspA family protein
MVKSNPGDNVILIAYDGSEDAREAINGAAKLFPAQPATIVTVWQRFVETMAGTGAGMAVVLDYDELDLAAEKAAVEKATDGAQLAGAAGLQATPRTAIAVGKVADTILFEAAELDAAAVVMGSRGLGGVKSLLLGSVSHAVLQNADRPVVVVPSPDVAKNRAERRGN